MRINVYSQELTEEVITVEKTSDTGVVYSGIRTVLDGSPRLHYRPDDDDRSGITFWLPRSPERREAIAVMFDRMAEQVRKARPETGHD